MATITHGVPGAGSLDLGGRLRHAAERFLAWRAQRREQARIITELNKFEDRDLRDLGLSRYDFMAIASGNFKR